MAISTDICAIYTIVTDEHSIRVWVFLEGGLMHRESLRFQVTQILQQQLPEEIIYFEFRVIGNARPPFDVESGGFWTYVQPGVSFSGQLQLFPATENIIQRWRERMGH